MAMASEEGPLDFEELIQFAPQAIVVGLYRNAEAFDRPVVDWTQDVLGYTPLTQMEQYPAINLMPIMLIGGGLREKDIPTTISYDIFLVFPKDIKLYVPKVNELVATVKTRRRISGYICPNCGNRLTFVKDQSKDLFCLRCHTSVALVEGDDAVTLYPSGRAERVSMEQLKPPSSEELPGT